MLLAADVGNTQTHLGAFEGTELARDWRIGTIPSATAHELAATIATLLELDGLSFDSLDGQSSPPSSRNSAPSTRRSARHGKALPTVGPNLKTGMPILVDNPHELGADRLVNAVAAHAHAKEPASRSTSAPPPTSTWSPGGRVPGRRDRARRRDLVGGACSRAAKLPRIDLSAPQGAIGKHTQAAIQSGFVYGFAGLVDGINRRLAEELGEKATFLATGGLAGTIAPHCETIDEVDELLTLRGLQLIYERNT